MTGIIDIDQLLSSVSEEEPSGPDMEYDPLFGEMERAATAKEEQQYGDTIIPAEEPDWKELKKTSLKVLAQSKDLRAAIHLTRALIHTDGFPGIADGLSLIKGLLTTYWDSVHPRLDPDDNNDPTLRINTLINLCDPTDFLLAINRVPVVSSSVMGQFSYRDMQIADGMIERSESDNKELSGELIDAAFREAGDEQNQETLNLINAASQCVTEIESYLNEQVGMDQSPDLTALPNLLNQIAQETSRHSGVGVGSGETAQDGQPQNAAGAAAMEAPPGTINSRDDVVRTLERISEYYAKHEPSSPVPLLLDRAKRLVKMDFHEIVEDLAPGGMSHFDFLWKPEDR
ncbi:MAG: type VI secretion system protein TssA [Candidatus Thiodiazotropha sp.]